MPGGHRGDDRQRSDRDVGQQTEPDDVAQRGGGCGDGAALEPAPDVVAAPA